MKNVGNIVKADLCVGCGVCKDVCPKDCIRISHGIVNVPMVDETGCIECGKCIKACPGQGVALDELSQEYFQGQQSEYNHYTGWYNQCFSGYSTDYEIRFHGASGGVVSHFLIFLLEQKMIDGAVVVGFKHDNPMAPVAYIARNRDEILSAKSSKYCVVAYDGIISEIQKNEGRYVVVGLPCHIHGFRKVACISKILSERIFGYFAIYCSAAKNMLSQDYFIWRYKVNKTKIARFAYRDYGCMGEMVFEDENGNDIVKKIPYLSYYLGAKGFFTPSRCMLCVDHFGELADVCFGDIQIGEYRNDKVGVSSIISRTSYWTSILLDAQKAGYLHLDEIDVTKLISSQGYCRQQKKGPGVVAEHRLRKVLGKARPIFNQPFVSKDAYMKDYIKSIMRIVMRFVGKRPSLWWVIKLIDKDKSR